MAHIAIHPHGAQSALARHAAAPARWMRAVIARVDPFQARAPFDVKETKDAWVFETDVPGIALSDLDVCISGGQLTVSGKRDYEHERDNDVHYVRERSHGSFLRSFTLPRGADQTSASADLEDGVLTIVFHKKPEMLASP